MSVLFRDFTGKKALGTFSSSYSASFNAEIRVSFLFTNRRCDSLKVRSAQPASPGPESAGEAAESSGVAQTLQLGAMFGTWYLLNIYFNIYNKQVLKVYSFPATFTAFQFACGTVMIILMWALNQTEDHSLTAILPLAVAHTMGNLLTNISLRKVSVSFTHTIKAMEPFFTVLFSALLLAEWPTIWVVSSLVPIVGGVALASFTEASFNWIGFGSAMASNITNQCTQQEVHGQQRGKPRIEHQTVVRKITSGWFLLPHLPAGTAMALAGVFLYSRAKRIKPKAA